MIKHRNIGHDWQFNRDQKALLQQYYEANKLLVACLHSECYLSRQVREEIESTLLLPVRTPAPKVKPANPGAVMPPTTLPPVEMMSTATTTAKTSESTQW